MSKNRRVIVLSVVGEEVLKRFKKLGVAISTFFCHSRSHFWPNCGRMAKQPKLNLYLCSTPTAAERMKSELKYLNKLKYCSNKLYLGFLLFRTAAAVDVKEERRFNFGCSANYPLPRPQAKKKL